MKVSRHIRMRPGLFQDSCTVSPLQPSLSGGKSRRRDSSTSSERRIRQNVSGDEVKKLDEFADETIYKAMDHGGHLCVMASEENEACCTFPTTTTPAST